MGTESYPQKVKETFYQREDVLQIAEETLGKFLFTRFDGILTGGMITEVEAYRGPEDKASHAYGNRKTARTQVMFEPGGCAYVYLCYGMHHLFNIVTHSAGIPHAILIRSLKPTHGIETMRQRRGKANLCSGPATLSQALGIHTRHSGTSLLGETIYLEDHGVVPKAICRTPRIGIDYAEEHKDLPWRFLIKETSPSANKQIGDHQKEPFP